MSWRQGRNVPQRHTTTGPVGKCPESACGYEVWLASGDCGGTGSDITTATIQHSDTGAEWCVSLLGLGCIDRCGRKHTTRSRQRGHNDATVHVTGNSCDGRIRLIARFASPQPLAQQIGPFVECIKQQHGATSRQRNRKCGAQSTAQHVNTGTRDR